MIPLTVRHRKTHTGEDGTVTNYSQFLGCGPPLDVLGRPGDIFVDMRDGAEGIFLKEGEWWIQWTGVIKLTGAQKRQGLNPILHPQNDRLTIWCNQDEVCWMDRGKLAAARGRVFTRFPGQGVITARQLIMESPRLLEEIADMYQGVGVRRRETRPEVNVNFRSGRT
jgi:hypothetical protein